MTEPIPSDDQLDRIADRVRERIEARGRHVRQVATSLVVVALVAGGIGLLAPALRSGGGSGSAAGSSSSRQAAPTSVRCHTTSASSSSSVHAPLPGGPSAAAARAACLDALAPAGGTTGSAAASPSTATGLRRLIVCRSGDVLEVFPAGDDPQGLCARNGLQPVVGGVVPLPVGTPAR